MKFQRDGNLVEYDLGNKNVILWASNTTDKDVTVAKLQPDGNFVIYSGNVRVVFAMGTDTSIYGTSGDRLVVQDDANIVIYDSKGQPI